MALTVTAEPVALVAMSRTALTAKEFAGGIIQIERHGLAVCLDSTALVMVARDEMPLVYKRVIPECSPARSC